MGEPYARRSARVLLIDDSDRILLFAFRNRSEQPPGHYWLTPGGGMHDGEPAAHAAARELREETGARVDPGDLGGPVATTSGYADFPGWLTGIFRDDFYFHRIGRFAIDDAGIEDYERGIILGHRWWSIAELAATAEVVRPRGLVALLGDLLAGRIPAAPVELPWHHAQ